MARRELSFTSDVSRVLGIVINALYSEREIFLRELISNASDALSKRRFLQLTDDTLAHSGELAIHIDANGPANTITIRDNGIGMNEQEVIDNLGSIASSGTKRFIDALAENKRADINQIGQFGVGFYAAFMVADKVSVHTRRAGTDADQAVLWLSEGGETYSIEPSEKDEPGTAITLHLKDDAKEFLADWRIKQIVKEYSNHIAFPIYMHKKREEDEKESEEGKIITVDDTPEYERINSAEAFWKRPKHDISDDEYKQFYSQLTNDDTAPLAWQHNHVEGRTEYTSLLYIPGRVPFDLWERKRYIGIKLYVQRVFILDDTERLLPNYLRFVRGLIDSNDLPLNVSRELLQDSRVVNTIRTASVKRALAMLKQLADNDADAYTKCWDMYGEVIKEGIVEDHEQKEAIVPLLRFPSTVSATPISISDYVGRMKTGQKAIYYLTAESLQAAEKSPHLEAFRDRGIEVLLLTHRIDEWVIPHLGEVDGVKLESVARGVLNIDALGEKSDDTEQKPSLKSLESEYADLLKRARTHLDNVAKNVRFTRRLTDSPACLVADDNAPGLHMQRMLEQLGQPVPDVKPILELNPDHPLIARLNSETDETRANELVDVLFDQAVLSEGGKLRDPAAFVRRMNALLLATNG